MLYKFKYTIAALVSSILISCGGSKGVEMDGDIPSWVNNYKSEYPDKDYISSLGVSEYKTMAEKQAYQGIASAFEVQIKSNQDSKETTFEDSDSFSQTYSEVFNINTQIDQNLINVETSKTYFDQNNNKYYVLATLNKSETYMMYLQERNKLMIEAEDVYSKSQQETDVLAKVALLSNSLFKLEEVDVIENKMRVLDKNSSSSNHFKSIHDLKIERAQIFQNLKVYVDPSDAKIHKDLTKEFNDLGLKLTDVPEESFLKILYDFSKEKSGVDNPDAKFILWNISIKLYRTDNDLTYGTYLAKGRSSQLNYKAAEERAYFDISKKLNKEFKPFLVKSILKVEN